MLELHNVTKTFGKNVTAVAGVSLRLEPGVVGLIGHNGAGKTTLMQMIATLTTPSGGRIVFDGTDVVARPDALRNRLGYLPQDFGVYRNVTALEFMRYFAALKGVSDAGRIRRLLELVNLHDQAGRMASTFSGGMLRRLGIAQALLNDPDVLVVDEPTAGLDPEERLRFRNLLADLGADKLVIISTHIVSDVESIAGRLAIMRSGRLVACDTPDAILGRARGQVWSASVAADEYEFLRSTTHVLQALRQGERVSLRIAHPTPPCAGAQPCEPSLEEALMAQRYAVKEAA
ncbi:ABC transporter ATP-binding protein [Massilia pinisoli]|uniref:ABC transporter ATP-binding protein n=1 Tax=Massilia pinisoli TaxID=1772194 RepID=A0ABT1ZRR8_9BURK|nr:ABC transporter ATP-binding protein [Massilia pinisoli]MCS0582606.1 ABC transporter ATP-binding protein [Massilia pinisoli]